jgi:hypothetical protein
MIIISHVDVAPWCEEFKVGNHIKETVIKYLYMSNIYIWMLMGLKGLVDTLWSQIFTYIIIACMYLGYVYINIIKTIIFK